MTTYRVLYTVLSPHGRVWRRSGGTFDTEAEAQAQASWIIDTTGDRLRELEIDKQTVVVETIWSHTPVLP